MQFNYLVDARDSTVNISTVLEVDDAKAVQYVYNQLPGD